LTSDGSLECAGQGDACQARADCGREGDVAALLGADRVRDQQCNSADDQDTARDDCDVGSQGERLGLVGVVALGFGAQLSRLA